MRILIGLRIILWIEYRQFELIIPSLNLSKSTVESLRGQFLAP